MRRTICAAHYLGDPMVGLDVLPKDRVRHCVGVVNGDGGTTIILATHDLTDVEGLCHDALTTHTAPVPSLYG